MTKKFHKCSGCADVQGKRYRKKPVVIEAIQWDGTDRSGTHIANWGGGKVEFIYGQPELPAQLRIHTLEGTMHASPGDYIIRGVAGELYPCKPAVFELTYEAVD